MLSQKSEQFLIELRMYLISKGKNDNEINEITSELEDHLLLAEADGKSVEYIVGNSPKQYMKSLGESMKTDFRQLLIFGPVVVILLAAYMSIGPSIEGKFALSGGIFWIAAIVTIIGILVFGYFLVKIVPKYFHSIWLYIIYFVLYTLVTGLQVVILLWYQKQGFEPAFVASPLQNNLIIIACVLIFIASAIYMKSWLTIFIPIITSIGPIGERFIPEHINKDPQYFPYAIIGSVIVVGGLLYLLYKKTNKTV